MKRKKLIKVRSTQLKANILYFYVYSGNSHIVLLREHTLEKNECFNSSLVDAV